MLPLGKPRGYSHREIFKLYIPIIKKMPKTYIPLEHHTRIELASTAWEAAILTFRRMMHKWTIQDLNLGPTGYEPVALTNWANGP